MTLTRKPKTTKKYDNSPKRILGSYVVIGHHNNMIDLFDAVDTAINCAKDYSLRSGCPASVWAKCSKILTSEEIYNTMLDESFTKLIKSINKNNVKCQNS